LETGSVRWSGKEWSSTQEWRNVRRVNEAFQRSQLELLLGNCNFLEQLFVEFSIKSVAIPLQGTGVASFGSWWKTMPHSICAGNASPTGQWWWIPA
jgi:hypothetical protein